MTNLFPTLTVLASLFRIDQLNQSQETLPSLDKQCSRSRPFLKSNLYNQILLKKISKSINPSLPGVNCSGIEAMGRRAGVRLYRLDQAVLARAQNCTRNNVGQGQVHI